MENAEWQIVEPDENGRIKCLDCSKTFYCMYYAKIHQYKCFKQRMEKISSQFEKLQNGWMVCLRCNKTFLSMQNAKIHYKNEHLDKSTKGD